jgi:hypothetical protein
LLRPDLADQKQTRPIEQEGQMQIDATSAGSVNQAPLETMKVKPPKPMTPIPPPGGNVENRQPPPEPAAPDGVDQSLDVFV